MGDNMTVWLAEVTDDRGEYDIQIGLYTTKELAIAACIKDDGASLVFKAITSHSPWLFAKHPKNPHIQYAVGPVTVKGETD